MLSFPPFLKLTLRQLILLLATGSALISMINVFYAGYLTQRDLLVNNTLEANRVYAAKLADSAHHFIKNTQQRLEYAAKALAEHFDDPSQLAQEVERLRLQTEGFNSVVVVGKDGGIRAVSPESLQLKGVFLSTEGAKEALKEQKPLISKPYLSVANNLIIFVSQPIKDSNGQFLGYIGGTIHLQKQNALYNLLGEHYYQDGSYLYVLDQDGRILYHPDSQLIGQYSSSSSILQASAQHETGTLRIQDEQQHLNMLAGYASIPQTDWTIVAQRPEQATLLDLDPLMQDMLLKSIPVAVVSFIILYYLARLISLPLWQLAKQAQKMDAKEASEHIQKIRSWYFEAAQIKSALLMGLALLNQKIGNLAQDTMTDPLTGLQNRRGLGATLETWHEEHTPFSIISLDLDHFKQINDTYGHDAGDKVIKYLAQTMRESSRGNDVLCRTGGEEFVILLPRVDLEIAKRVAERLRVRMELADIPDLDINITLSFGVASWQPAGGQSIDEILKIADQALYTAKQEGRNRVVALQ